MSAHGPARKAPLPAQGAPARPRLDGGGCRKRPGNLKASHCLGLGVADGDGRALIPTHCRCIKRPLFFLLFKSDRRRRLERSGFKPLCAHGPPVANGSLDRFIIMQFYYFYSFQTAAAGLSAVALTARPPPISVPASG